MLIPGMKSRPEEEEQAAFFAYLAGQLREYPWLIVAHAVPNGGARPARTVIRRGKACRFSVEGQKLKRQGQRPGVPDVCIPAPRGPYHGLYLEFKRMPYLDAKGRTVKEYPSPEQRVYRRWLTVLGYLVVTCYGKDDAILVLKNYIALAPGPGANFSCFEDPEFLTVTAKTELEIRYETFGKNS